MNLALMQAKKILGNTGTNPAVGAVIVKNNQVQSAAHTSFNGRPHAERNAIDLFKKEPIGCDLYVTLEPCSNYGITSPCTSLIIKKKFKRVYFSIPDPDIKSYKKAKKEFTKYNIKTNIGLLNSKVNFWFLRSTNEAKEEPKPKAFIPLILS